MDMSSGFLLDPYPIRFNSGGAIDASYLGGGCAGNATARPEISIYWTSGGGTLLRFYYIGEFDPTLIINGPDGAWVCDNDSYGTTNPTIDFNNPSSGRYDIWVGNLFPGQAMGGTLYVTERDTEHP